MFPLSISATNMSFNFWITSSTNPRVWEAENMVSSGDSEFSIDGAKSTIDLTGDKTRVWQELLGKEKTIRTLTSNFSIWSAGGYIFGYDEIDTTMEVEETPQAREATIAWETRQLGIMDWITNDVDWMTASTAGNATLSQSEDAHSGKYSVKVGGSPNIWNACTVFFQTALLFGYRL